jgi:hypothetical protein
MVKYKPVFKYCKPTYNVFEGKHQANNIENLYYITYPGKLSDLNEEILQFLSFIFYGIENPQKTGFDPFTFFDKQELNEILIEQIILNISRIRPTIGDDRYNKYNNEIINLLNDYKKNIILNSAGKYFNDFFKNIDNTSNLSINDFQTVINQATQNFKTEIITNLENKESDTSKIFYIERIKNKFSELVPEINEIRIYPLKYKKSCDIWCKQYDCTNSTQLFQTFSSRLSPLFETVPVDLDNLTDFPKARKIFFDFLYFIRFSSIKEVYEYLLKQVNIIIPPPVLIQPKIEGPMYHTEKTLKFIKKQFENQISENSLTRLHIIHSNFPFLNFDIARNEIISYNKDNNKPTVLALYKLAKENIEKYNSTIIHFTGDELGIKAYNIQSEKEEFIKHNSLEQRYILRDDKIYYSSVDSLTFSQLLPDETEYQFFNEDLYEYSYKILNFINETHTEIFNQKKHDTMTEEKVESDFLSDMYYSRMLYDSFKKDHNLLKTYIEVEAKKVNDNYVEPEIFFKRCNETIIKFFNLVNIKINDRKSEINFRLQRALNKETVFPHYDTDLTIEQKFEEEIEYCNNELEMIDIVKFSADIRGMTKREFDSHLKYNEIQFIKNAIDEACKIFEPAHSSAVVSVIAEGVKFNDKIINKQPVSFVNLYNKLIDIYFKDISLNDFTEIMIHKRLPNGKNKIFWCECKADGIRFADHYVFSLKQFNACFYPANGKFKRNNQDKTGTVSTLTSILNKF